jgi:plastocyanin
MMIRRTWIACALVSVLAYGCGDDDNDDGTAGTGGTGGTTAGAGAGGTGGAGTGGTGGAGTGGAGAGGAGAGGTDAGADLDAGEEDAGNGNGSNGNGERRIEIIATEFMFTPGQITATAGETLIVVLVNMGVDDHSITFELPAGDATLGAEVQPGQQGELTMLVPDEPGDHAFYCPVPGHRLLGMEGTLTIE